MYLVFGVEASFEIWITNQTHMPCHMTRNDSWLMNKTSGCHAFNINLIHLQSWILNGVINRTILLAIVGYCCWKAAAFSVDPAVSVFQQRWFHIHSCACIHPSSIWKALGDICTNSTRSDHKNTHCLRKHTVHTHALVTCFVNNSFYIFA